MLCAFDCSSDPLSVAHEELKLEWHNDDDEEDDDDDDDDNDGDNSEVSSISKRQLGEVKLKKNKYWCA